MKYSTFLISFLVTKTTSWIRHNQFKSTSSRTQVLNDPLHPTKEQDSVFAIHARPFEPQAETRAGWKTYFILVSKAKTGRSRRKSFFFGAAVPTTMLRFSLKLYLFSEWWQVRPRQVVGVGWDRLCETTTYFSDVKLGPQMGGDGGKDGCFDEQALRRSNGSGKFIHSQSA